ncbi:hypothetical protein [Acanthamoeba polyphaga mimivirus]|uniref:Ankyrin repeat protein n=1 Tax=Acanthamoeba polyphaga mimivirus TaxID=212035 RepID=A0A2L2DKF9_MIMIV|nr:hypothetical protein [Acanthamoeba polyphaga mimivirus]
MEKHISYILTQIKTLTPIPVIDEDIPRLEEYIKYELYKILKKILTKWIEEDFCLDNVSDNDNDNDDNDNDDNDDGHFVNLQINKKKLNTEIKKKLDLIAKIISYDYINIKCRQEYINGNREKVMSYFPYIDINYNYYKLNIYNKDHCCILYYAADRGDIEMAKIILEMKPHNFYEVGKTDNIEMIGLYIDYVCDNNIYLDDDGRLRYYYYRSHKIRELICKHPRAKEFLGSSYDNLAKKYFDNNSKY